MGYVHSDRALELLIALWHDHHKDGEHHAPLPRTGSPCHICKPLHFLLGWSWEEYKRWAETSVQPERKESAIGTRGVIGVIVDGIAKVTYNHFDSYPDGLGVATLVPLRLRAEGGGEWQELVDKAREMRLIDESGPAPTPEDIIALAKYLDLRVGEQSPQDWYALMRGMQGKLLTNLETGYMLDAADFPLDSLFCEWGYVLNLDAMTFEVYEGFQHHPHNEGFWAGKAVTGGASRSREYHPIRLVQSWPLADLPTKEQFLASFTEGDTK